MSVARPLLILAVLAGSCSRAPSQAPAIAPVASPSDPPQSDPPQSDPPQSDPPQADPPADPPTTAAPADNPVHARRCAELLAQAEDSRPAVSTRGFDGLVSSCPERFPALLLVLRAHLQRGSLRFEHVVRLRGMIKRGGDVVAVHGDEIAALLEQVALSPAMFNEARTRAIEGVALHDRARAHALAVKLGDDPDHRVATAARVYSRLLGRAN